MKRTLLLLNLLWLSMMATGQLNVQWSDPLTVAEYGENDLYSNPQVAVTESGVVNVVWAATQESVSNAMHSWKNGEVFELTSVINENSEIQTYNQLYGPHIAAQGEVVFITYEKMPDLLTGSIVSIKSSNGGLTWANEVNVEEYLNGDHAAHPHLAIDGGGHPHVSMTRYYGDQSDVGAICSVNLGASYTPFIPASDESMALYVNPAYLVIDDDRHIVLWMESVAGDYLLNAAISTNNGATFGSPVVLNDMVYPEEDLEGLELKGFVMDDELFVAWTSVGIYTDVRYSKLTIPGLQADENILVSQPGDDLVSATSPSIAGGEGNLAIAWQTGFAEEADIWIATSDSYPNPAEQEYIWDDSANRHSPNLWYQDGFHMVYVNADENAIKYVFGEVLDDTRVDVSLNGYELKVYPNPAKDILNIDCSLTGEDTWQITNASGQVCLSGSTSGKSTIQLADLPQGTYYFSVMGPELGITETFLIRR
jgi:hypothetical protein